MTPNDELWVKELYEQNSQKMFHIAVIRLRDEDAANDVVQNAFLDLLAKLEVVKSHPNPVGWLMSALKICIRRELEAQAKHAKYETPLDDERHDQMGGEQGYVPPLRDILPPGLTPREEDLLVWYYEDGLSYEEISQRLGIPILTCRTQMFRARAHYRKLAERRKEFSEIM